MVESYKEYLLIGELIDGGDIVLIVMPTDFLPAFL